MNSIRRHKPIFGLALGVHLFLVGCQESMDELQPSQNPVDQALEAALTRASGGIGPAYFELPEQGLYDRLPQDPLNPITQDKVNLGKLLFHETGIALAPLHTIGQGTFSCASCHFADAGFQANRWQGIADGGSGASTGRVRNPQYSGDELDVQPIRSPATLNNAFQSNMLWNGQFGATGVNVGTESKWTEDTPKEVNHLGFSGVESQAIAGMDVHRLVINRDIIDSLGYLQLFDRAFIQIPESERYSKITAGLAIAAFERTIVADLAPFQLWLKGYQDAMTEQQKRGAVLFFDKAGCASCHTGPALNSMAFYAYGMEDLHKCPEPVFKTSNSSVEHLGRGGFTGNPSDDYKFKVPQLYNLKDSPFYGHGSSFRSLREVVEYKNQGVPQLMTIPSHLIADEFKPLQLSEDEIDAIVDFLSNGLYDPLLRRYQPETIPSGFCFPFNDPQSRIDLGCD